MSRAREPRVSISDMAKGLAKSDAEFAMWRNLLTDYLRPQRPSFTACYERLVLGFRPGAAFKVPSRSTLLRRLDRYSAQARTAKRGH